MSLSRAANWLFRNRRTGKITIAQWPNLPLAVFIVAAGIRRYAGWHGTPRTVVDVIATIALLAWALWEITRGVNPFRRLLGGAVLALTAVGLVLH